MSEGERVLFFFGSPSSVVISSSDSKQASKRFLLSS